MKTMAYVFTANYKADMHRHIDDLFTDAKVLNTDRQSRIKESDALVESYFAHCGLVPDGVPLERLATLILREELTDSHPDKVTRTAYPILSEDQLERRDDAEFKLSDVHYGRDTTTGFRKTIHEDENGVTQVNRKRIYDFPR